MLNTPEIVMSDPEKRKNHNPIHRSKSRSSLAGFGNIFAFFPGLSPGATNIKPLTGFPRVLVIDGYREGLGYNEKGPIYTDNHPSR